MGKITVRYETTTIRDGEYVTSSGVGSVGGSSVKIEFTDADKNRPIKRSEAYAVTHAALSNEAYVLADQSSVYFNRYALSSLEISNLFKIQGSLVFRQHLGHQSSCRRVC